MSQVVDNISTVEVGRELPPHVGRTHFRLGVRAGAQWSAACLAVDAVMLALAALASGWGGSAAGFPAASPGWTVAFGSIVVLLLAARGLYRDAFRLRTIDDVREIVTAVALTAGALLAGAAVVGADSSAVDQVLRLWLFATAYVSAGRVSLYWSQLQARRAGECLRPTLIVGAGRVGRLAARRLLDMPQLGLKPVGFLDRDPLEDDGKGALLPVLGASWDLDDVVREHGVEQVLITFSTAPNDVLLRLVRRCEELGVAVAMVPRLYERTTTRMTVDHIGGLPLISAHAADPRGLQFAIKYVSDRIVSGLLIVVLSPILLGAALATYLSLGRPIFFQQRRVGRDGVEFDMLKFRTMRVADMQEPTFALKEGFAPGGVEGTDRRTRMGRFLRTTSLDELPQLFNVLTGDMSLVGPRPERPEYVTRFDDAVYRYVDRHRVKAGITGWAQVNGLRGQTSIADRAEWDNHYIENFSLWLDLKILLLTFAAVFAASTSGE